ncbi:MAG: flavin reductase family protein [Sulfurospirillaceae bacterium]|jgi:flavin reductase (DIM6/NTAB) family NADH-FMN oxidoreductase RutF|nr:flavin reductase family protein [Sulfurospirillaceae bacterium]MDD2825686.1 flavin reductase family protein [Sulfurospirillaceae bacterium]
MLLNYDEINDLDRYKIMSGTVIPRPIAWIVTEDDGVINAAPFSYFIPLSSNPATLVVSIGKKNDTTPKDTLANILKTKKATICFANKENLEKLKLCANALAKNESEIQTYAIEVSKVLEDFPPMISSSQSAFFCEFYDTIKIPGATTPVILEIKKQFIEDNRIDAKMHVSVENVGRVGTSFAAMVVL